MPVINRKTMQLPYLNEYVDIYIYLKIYSHKTNIFLVFFLALCSPVNLLKHNIYALLGRLKQYFACFDCSIFYALFYYLVEKPVQSFKLRQVSLLPPEELGRVNK